MTSYSCMNLFVFLEIMILVAFLSLLLGHTVCSTLVLPFMPLVYGTRYLFLFKILLLWIFFISRRTFYLATLRDINWKAFRAQCEFTLYKNNFSFSLCNEV